MELLAAYTISTAPKTSLMLNFNFLNPILCLGNQLNSPTFIHI